nr:hypothetical protein [Tanacetum cinerariifolium]
MHIMDNRLETVTSTRYWRILLDKQEDGVDVTANSLPPGVINTNLVHNKKLLLQAATPKEIQILMYVLWVS